MNLGSVCLVVVRYRSALRKHDQRTAQKDGGRQKQNPDVASAGHRHRLINDELGARSFAVSGHRRESGILVQFVSDAAHGQHIMGVLGISFQLLSQPIDMRLDVPLIAFVLGTPDTIEQVVARPGPARL